MKESGYLWPFVSVLLTLFIEEVLRLKKRPK